MIENAKNPFEVYRALTPWHVVAADSANAHLGQYPKEI
jgi:hypothetical protein